MKRINDDKNLPLLLSDSDSSVTINCETEEELTLTIYLRSANLRAWYTACIKVKRNDFQLMK